MMRHAVLS